jgi:ankyrin repeat protein
MTRLLCICLGTSSLACSHRVNERITSRANEVNQAICGAMQGPMNGPDSKLVMESQISILQCLLSVPGVNVNAMAKGETLFLFAVRCRSVALVDALLEFPETDVNEYGQQGNPLHIALDKSFHEIALKLINSDRLDLTRPSMRNVLCLAVQKSDMAIVKALVARNSSPEFLNAFDPQYGSSLCAACQSQHFDVAKLLLSLPNIDLSVHDRHLKTPLILAERQGNLSLVQAIVSFYSDRIKSKLNEVNQAIRSAMRTPRGGLLTDMLHPMESRILVILCLISIPGADVNSTVKTENLFLFAARHGSIELIDKLLQYPETEVNGYSQHGTALHIALEKSFQ